ncbi:cation diffusion facilitator family transporter [Tsukamurella strandjordii]|uniref:cation diffusion facilitator family transporter n=1 Tax=Tsukamurella TaxID=2060 RepID=UPI002088CD9E|nr:cation diffusion facilitator family transporter [Tsukamurella sp. TY48]GIZ96062.1 putative cation transporter [Tsukamurella sp. TY48]
MGADGHSHAGHDHGVSADADKRWLSLALALIVAFMAIEVTIGIMASSLALITDAAHMLTDAAAIVLALFAIKIAAKPAQGGYTYGLKRAEILSAQANGITLLLLAVYFVYEGISRIIDPPNVDGKLVFFTALAGCAVNIAATMCIRRANRESLNVEGAYQHILNDLYAFIATAIAGAIIWATGWGQADAIAALVVAALMFKAGWGLVKASGRIFLEAAPEGVDPSAVGADIASVPSVEEVHDLHIWEITSGQAAMSAHILVTPGADCHAVRATVAKRLHDDYDIEHATLQVDHVGDEDHCDEPHGEAYRSADQAASDVPTVSAPAGTPTPAAAPAPVAKADDHAPKNGGTT